MRKILFIATLIAGSVAWANKDGKDEDSITRCLKAWGKHPFGKNPEVKTLKTTVKVFGLGGNTPKDIEPTKEPSLVLVNPAVNVMGGTTFELLNPNGWYCFRSNVNIMGGLTLKADCKSHIAFASNGTTFLGTASSEDKGVTVMGSTQVKYVNCASAAATPDAKK